MSRALGMVVVTVHGELGAASSGQLRYILWDLIDQQGNRNVVVDLRDMTLGDGADHELFVDAARRAREGGGYLTLSGPCPATAAAFARAGLSEALEVEPSGSCRPFSRPGR
jgi:anti-anti-sigma factor